MMNKTGFFALAVVAGSFFPILRAEAQDQDSSSPWGAEIFPLDYLDSRQNFRDLCAGMRLGAPSVECLSHTLENEDQEDLTIDSLWAPAPKAKKILVLVSGIHGAEASTGAAIQFQFIMNDLPRFTEKGISVLLIHSLNPWGFAHGRRVTSNNVDLNRNFPSKDDADWKANSGYEKLRSFLEPAHLKSTGFWPFLRFAVGLLWKVATFQFTLEEMHQAVASGQRESPKGLFYGGHAPEPQIQHLQSFLEYYLKGYQEAVMIDLHTGLGDAGTLHLMPSDQPSPSGEALRHRLFQSPENDIYKITTEKTAGFYQVSGDFLDFAEERGPEGLQVAAMTMEFGTRGSGVPAQLKSLFIMVAENQSFQDLSTSAEWPREQQQRAQADFAELFAPSSVEWRQEVLHKASAFFEQLLRRF